MKNLIKGMRNALYILLPLCFFAAIHLAFAYGNWDFNPSNWTEPSRGMAAVLGIFAAFGGGMLAYAINDDYQKY